MGLYDKAAALERRHKDLLKPGFSITLAVNPCYECEGCEKCAAYHKEMSKKQEGTVILVEGEDPDE